MSFLQPLFLFALPLAGLPILLHLLARRTRRVVRFPWIRLLLMADTEGGRRSRLTEILLLLLRTLFLLTLLLAFARPVWVREGIGPIRRVYVDRSHSMAGWDPWPAVQTLRSRFPELRPIPFAHHLLPSSRQLTYFPTAFRVIQTGEGGWTAVVTDLQATGLAGARLKGPVLFVRPQPPEEPGNGALRMEALSALPVPGTPLPLRVRVRNFSEKTLRRRFLLRGGDRVLEEADLALGPRRDTSFILQVLLPDPPVLTGELEPPDRMQGDDIFYLPLRPFPRLRYWLEGPSPAAGVLRAALSVASVETAPDVREADLLVLVGGTALRRHLDRVAGTPTLYFAEKPRELGAWGLQMSPPVRYTGPILAPGMPVDRGMARFEALMTLQGPGWTPLLLTETGKWIAARKGNLVVFGFSPDPQKTDVILSPLFAPLLQGVLVELLQQDRPEALTVQVGEEAQVRVPEPGVYGLLRGRDTLDFLVGEVAGEGSVVRIPELPEPGIYRLERGGRVWAWIGANLAPEESDPTPASEAVAQTHVEGEVRVVSSDRLGATLGAVFPLQLLFLRLSALFLLLEMALLGFLRFLSRR